MLNNTGRSIYPYEVLENIIARRECQTLNKLLQ